jgi:hypothetical protein
MSTERKEYRRRSLKAAKVIAPELGLIDANLRNIPEDRPKR